MRRAAVMVGAIAGISLALLVVALLIYDKAAPTPKYVLDENAGAYRGVPLGATREEAVAVLGSAPRWQDDEPIGPLDDDWEEIGAPQTIASSGQPDALRYPHLSVMLDDGRVTVIVTAEKGAETRAGVAVGDSLREAQTAYPNLICDDRSLSHGGSFPYCGGRLEPGRWLWFGEDPIASITIASLEVT